MKRLIITTILIVCFVAASGRADPFSWMIGDNDGYGLAPPIPDNGSTLIGWTNLTPMDNRSAAEAAATDGTELTDTYSTIHGAYSPPPPGPLGTVDFALAKDLISATLEVDMGDFQGLTFGGPILVSYNGVAAGNWNFADGYQNTQIRTFALSAAAIANANTTGQFVLGLDRNGSGDFVSFDYFKLEGEMVPVPGAVLLGILGLSVAGVKLRKFS